MDDKADIIITAMNPTPSTIGEMNSDLAPYDTLCERSIKLAMSYGTAVVVAFGSVCRVRWVQWCQLRVTTGAIRSLAYEWCGGIRRLRFERQTSGGWLPTTVFFSPDPRAWSQRRVVTAALGYAFFGDAWTPQPAISKRSDMMTMQVERIEPEAAASAFQVTNIEIESDTEDGRRFVLEGGIVTHNSIENLVVRLGDFGIARVLNGTNELAMSVVGTVSNTRTHTHGHVSPPLR